MTYQPQPYQPQPGYGSMSPVQPGGPALGVRGRTPLRLGIIFLIVGIVLIVVGGVVVYKQTDSKVDGFPRISVPQAGHVNSSEIAFGTGGYVAYYEAADASSNAIPAVPVRLTSPSGTSAVLQTPYGGTNGGQRVKSLSYDVGGHHGVALWQFNIAQAGTYKVEVAGNSRAAAGSDLAFGRSVGKATAVGAGLIAPGALLFLAGLVLLIVGIVKRRRSKRELAQAGVGYGSAPPGYPPAGYGPAAYGQPGYGAPPQQYAQPPPGYGPPGYPPQGPQGQPPAEQGFGRPSGYVAPASPPDQPAPNQPGQQEAESPWRPPEQPIQPGQPTRPERHSDAPDRPAGDGGSDPTRPW